MLLFDVPSGGVDVSIAILQLVGSWSDHLHNRVRSFPGRIELVPFLGRLRPMQHQIANFEGSSPDLPLMVPTKGLLVAGRANQGRLSCLLQSGRPHPAELPQLGRGQRL
jgi:hypothetical protein